MARYMKNNSRTIRFKNQTLINNWMIDGSWNKKESAKSLEPVLKVEDWMLKPFDSGKEETL